MACDWHNVRFEVAAANLLDPQFEYPLGGTSQSALYAPAYALPTFHALSALGRYL